MSRHTIKDIKKRIDLDRQVTEQITELGIDTPWVEGKAEFKKSSLVFARTFWWTIIRHYLSPTYAEPCLLQY